MRGYDSKWQNKVRVILSQHKMIKFKVLSGIEGLNRRRSEGHDRQPEVSRTSPHSLRMSSRSRGHVADAKTQDVRL